MVIGLSAIETRTVARKDTKGGAHNNVEPVVDPRGHKSWQWHIVARQLEASIAVQLIPNVWVLGLITLTASTRLYLRDTSSSAFSAGGLSLSALGQHPSSVCRQLQPQQPVIMGSLKRWFGGKSGCGVHTIGIPHCSEFPSHWLLSSQPVSQWVSGVSLSFMESINCIFWRTTTETVPQFIDIPFRWPGIGCT